MMTEVRSIRLAKLGLLAPDKVYEELMKYREGLLASTSSLDWIWSGDDVLEARLLVRDEPLIDLGLAVAGNSTDVLRVLWSKYDERDEKLSLAIKIGILGGTNVQAIPTSELARILEGAYVVAFDQNDEMSSAILMNKRARRVIEEFLKRRAPFDGASHERIPVLLHALSKNDCINVDGSDMDSPDLTYWGIRKGLFDMVTQAPVTTSWLYPLYDLLSAIEEPYYSKTQEEFDFPAFVTKWRKLHDKEESSISGYYTSLPLLEEFLCLFACVFGYKEFAVGAELTDEEQIDAVYRCAYYSRAQLSKSQILKAIDKDGSIFILSSLYNDWLLLNNDKQALIQGELSGGLSNLYAKRVQRLKNKYKWFVPAASGSTQGSFESRSNDLRDTIDALRSSFNTQSSAYEKLKNIVYGALISAVIIYLAG